MAYLINQYPPGHRFYPANAKKRVEVDRILYLTAELWERFRPMIDGPFYEPPTKQVKENCFELLKALGQLTTGRKFLGGDEMSIADICFACELTELTDTMDISVENVAPGVGEWSKRMKTTLPEYDELITKLMIESEALFERLVGSELRTEDRGV